MGIKNKVNPGQWQALFNAPSAVCVYVSMANGSGLEIFKEFFRADKFVKNLAKETRAGSYGEMVKEFVDEVKVMPKREAAAYASAYQSDDLAGIRAEAKAIAVAGAAAASTLPDGEGFKRWMLETARQLAETKTGGFLGLGAVPIMEGHKQAALTELQNLFGL